MSRRSEVLVVGAGIVGLASALELAQRGHAVTVVDRGPADGGCAVGSAGHLVPSHVVPLAAPGALATAWSGLRRRDGAVSVRWSADPQLWRWMACFVRSCTRASVESAAPALGELAALSDRLWDDWLEAAPQPVLTEGLLDVYASSRAFDAAAAHADEWRRWGVKVDVVDAARAQALEPALLGAVAGGVHLPDDRSLDPAQAMTALVARVVAAGVLVVPFADVTDVVTAGDVVTGVRTSAGDFDADAVVVAAGAWSAGLARRLGERVPVIAGRGMSITVDRPRVGPRRPLLLGEDHVAVGAFGDQLRLSAWFQLNHTSVTPDDRRLARLEAIARRRLQLDEQLVVRRRWAGLRPVTPDGVPIIGRSPRWRNVVIATGHSMTGLTLGPGTGRVVAQLVGGEATDIPVERFAVERFG